ncbi:S1 family peptidase [Micromonospora sp. NPDC002389]|uniref:S1 family peptidase n=1 Tax=Micromonospora sp. NPDC002389 TaxID=3154272 RepID=UPI003323E651
MTNVPERSVIQPTTVAIKPTPEELHDLKQFAAQHAMDLETTVDKYAWRHEFARAVGHLRATYADTFADAAIAPGANYDAWISFSGSAPPDIASHLTTVPARVEIREHLGWDEASLVQAAKDVHYAVLAEAGPNARVATNPDTTTGTIRVAVGSQPGIAAARVADHIRSTLEAGPVAAAINATPPAVRLEIEATSQLDGGVDTVYGGGSLSSCTAGFPVRRSTDTSQHGLTTAGHCGNSQAYESRSVLTFISAHEGAQGDMQWHRSSEAVGNQFYYDSGVRRNAQTVGHPTPGISVCKFGKTSGATCDEVYQLNQCRDQYCGLAMTHRRKAAGGDSGGPWYWGTAAYGVHSGYKTYNLLTRDMFTPTQQVHITLGLLLKTT